ncbi:hypothetical protein FRC08_008908, partial [Ceratobasidium sp. 394]
IVCFPRHVLHAPPIKDRRRARGTLPGGTRATVGASSQPPLVPASVEVIEIDTTDEEPDHEQDASGRTQKCWILILDSLGGKHPNTVRILREFLQVEAKQRHGKLVQTKNTKLSGGLIEDRHLPVPIQPNYCDCGLYLLHNVETFVSNPLELLALPALTRKQSSYISQYNKLWRGEDVLKKRDHFRKTVMTLSANWRKSKSKD